MHHQTYNEIQHIMLDYMTKGKKSMQYKRAQMKRLTAIIDNIMEHEFDSRLEAIGRRQIIRYWKRFEDQANNTRRGKYHILKKFFSAYNPKVTVPEPK